MATASNPHFVGVISTAVFKPVIDNILPEITRQVAMAVELSITPLMTAVENLSKLVSSQYAEIQSLHDANNNLSSSVSEQCTEIANLKEEKCILQMRVNTLEDRLTCVESAVEEQEQYSRRNCLRFRVPTPTDPSSVNTDVTVINICNDLLGVSVSPGDIGRSHFVGKAKDGFSQIIVRFVTHNKRNDVYRAKARLKNNPKKIFLTEDLTRFRARVVSRLNTLRNDKKINSFWTNDGRIFTKITAEGPKILIKSDSDVSALVET